MKKVLLPALLLNAALAFGQNITLEGKLPGLKAGKKVYLSPISSTGSPDSSVTTAGAFKIITKATEGDIYFLRIGGAQSAGGSSLLLYIAPGKLQITGKDSTLQKVTYAGAPYAADQNSLAALMESPVFKKTQELAKELNATYKTDTARFNVVKKEYDGLEDERTGTYEKWIDQHSASPVSAMVLSFNLRYEDMDKLEARLKTLKPAAKDNALGRKMQHSINASRATAIGKVAPEFTQNDTLGKPVALKDFRGKYVLVDFWASWCVPCRKENPAVVKAFHEYSNKNFTILSVSLDRPGAQDKWLQAIHDDGLTWTHVSDLNWWSNAVSKLYDIHSIPANYLLGPDGTILAKNLRGEALEQKLAEVLK